MNALPTFKIKRYGHIFSPGDPCAGAWILVRGKIGISSKTRRRPVTVCYQEPGAVLALAETVNGCCHLTGAVAKTDCELLFVPRKDVLDIIQDDPPTGMEMLQVMSDELSAVYRTIREMRFQKRSPAPAL